MGEKIEAKILKITLQILHSKYDLPDGFVIDLPAAADYLNKKFDDECARYEWRINKMFIKFEGAKFNISVRGKIWTASTNFSKKELIEKINKIGKCLNKFAIKKLKA